MLPNDFIYRFSDLATYAPIGLIGVWRWSVWFFQKVIGAWYRATPTNPTASLFPLSIVTPVYNENPVLFQQALFSWAQNRPQEIIAIIDASDTACIGVFQTFQKHFHPTMLIVTDTPGKRPALALGSRRATGQIVALVDSDTVWDDDIRDTLLAPFADESVGGVACRQAVLTPVTPAEKLFDIRFSIRYLHEYPYLMRVGDALTCLSGRTAVYRRAALLPVLDEMLDETFLWKKCISGEDKRLTSLIMRNGWKVRYQNSATVRTQGMSGLRRFFDQNLRWSRNSWRTDLRLIGSAWVWRREPFFAYHLVDRAVQPFTLLLGPIYLTVALYFQHWLAAILLLTWFFASRTIKLLPHLREKPGDIRYVPLFTIAQYHLAVLKLYALLTLDFQSWITRWDLRRLKRSVFGLLPSRAATLAIITGIGYFVFSDAAIVAQALETQRERSIIPYTDDFSPLRLEEQEAEFWHERQTHEYAEYATRPRETPRSVLHKFNIPEERMEALFPKRLPDRFLPANTKVRFPITDLRHTISPAAVAATTALPVKITYRPEENMIHITGKGTVIKLATIQAALPSGQTLLVETTPGEWLLRSKLYVSEGVTLVLDGAEVARLKIASSANGFSYIRSQHGRILINHTSVTSWDESLQAPDTDISDGRAFIVAYGSGRMDVQHSDIGYLGFPLEVAKQYQDFGGNYGLSWKLQNGTFGRYAMAGNVTGNRVHHNYFGLYAYGASGMLITENEFFENLEYGIDPHDDSNNLIIENNFVHDNGNHGIIGSKRVRYSTIRSNRSVNNRLHGIMLDKDTDYLLVENNTVSGNVNGITLADSHHNLVRNNRIVANRFGIRASIGSSKNTFSGNTISRNERGVFLYEDAQRNIIRDNTIAENGEGVYLKNAKLNAVIHSLKQGDNRLDIKLNDSAQYTNFIGSIP